MTLQSWPFQHLHLLERISPVIEADARNADIAGNAVLSRIDPANETVLRGAIQ